MTRKRTSVVRRRTGQSLQSTSLRSPPLKGCVLGLEYGAKRQRFAQENVTTTLLAYLAMYKTFKNSARFKRVVGLMHRQVVKAQAEGLYFQVSSTTESS